MFLGSVTFFEGFQLILQVVWTVISSDGAAILMSNISVRIWWSSHVLVGTGWCASDGVEDAHRSRQIAPWTIVHWVYLEEMDC